VRDTKERVALAVGSIIVVLSVVIAFVIHLPIVRCSYLGGEVAPKCPQPTGWLIVIRAGIIICGLIIALAIYIATRRLARRRR
jgi:hypothetical protein